MKLLLPIPADWSIEQNGSERTVTLAGNTKLTISDVFGAADDDARFVERELRKGLAPDVVLTVAQSSSLKTNRGWPITLVQAVASTKEARLIVYFRFMTYAAFALLIAPSAEALERARGPVLDVLGQAAPDWTMQGIVAVAQLWENLEGN